MRPNVDKDIKISYAVLAGVLLLGLIAIGVYYDWGELADEVSGAEGAYQTRRGPLLMSQQVARLKEANQHLEARIEELKKQVGIREVPPFVLPEEQSKQGEYFFRVYSQIRDLLREEARVRSIEYDEYLGFSYLQGVPPKEQVREHLILLQLVTKAVYLSMQTPRQEVRKIEVRGIRMRRDVRFAGPPPDRRNAPLLREYHFTLDIEGSLPDLLWIKHRLSVDNPPTPQHENLKKWLQRITDDVLKKDEIARIAARRTLGNEISPLIVTGCTLESPNESPEDGLTQLTLRIDLAGMEFLDKSVSWDGKQKRGSGRNSGGGGSKRSGSVNHRKARP